MSEPEIVDAETIKTDLPVVQGSGMAVALTQAEIDLQITTAKAHPRPPVSAITASIKSLVTIDERAAEQAVYALPRAGKPVRGPSIRLAEIIKQTWGNNRVNSRVIGVDRGEKVVIAEATWHDLQTNSAERVEERRSIVDKHGRFFNHDLIVVAGKAAAAIARRNVILTGVPQSVWWPAFQAAEQVIAGDVRTLVERRDRALKAFAVFGVKPEQIFAALEVGGLDDITLDHLTTLQGMHQAIKNGDSTVEEMFPKERAAPADAWKPPPQQQTPSETAHDAQTGEIIDEHMVVSKLDLIVSENSVEDWGSWGRRFLQRIAAAPDLLHVDEWEKQNSTMLDSMKQDQPKAFVFVENALKARRQELQRQAQEKKNGGKDEHHSN